MKGINHNIAQFNTAARQEIQQSPEVIQHNKSIRYPLNKIFEVQSAAIGDGVYNCYEQIVINAAWDDTSEASKIGDKDEEPVAIKVLNLAEHKPNAGQHNLVEGDVLVAWQVIDDGGARRWVGIPAIQAYVYVAGQPTMAKSVWKINSSGNLVFTAGGTREITEDITVYGAISGASAQVDSLFVTSGSWAEGDAAGILSLINQSGTFIAENLRLDQSPITLFEDAGGGKVNVTSVNHGVATGNKVLITETINYNNAYIATRIDNDVFQITAVYYAETAGYCSIYLAAISGELVWAYNTYRYAYGIAIDAADNVYVAGIRVGGKSVWKLDNSGNLIWSYNTGDDTYAIAIGPDGNVYVAGSQVNGKSVWKLDGSTGVLIRDYHIGNDAYGIAVDLSNIYVAGHPVSGKSVWKLDISTGEVIGDYGTGNTTRGITLDAAGNIYVVGYMHPMTWSNVFKLDNSCGLIWEYATGGIFVEGIAVDSDHNVYISGARTNGKSVWKLNSSGTSIIWSFDTESFAHDITIDDADNVYVGGNSGIDGKNIWKLNSSGGLIWDFNTGRNVFSIAVNSGGKVYAAGGAGGINVQKIGIGRDLIWGYGANNIDLPAAYCIAVDSTDNVYFGSSETATILGLMSVFKLDKTGKLVWSYYTGNEVFDIAVDSGGNVYMVGSIGTNNKSVWKLNSSGDLDWSYFTGSHTLGIAIDAADNVYVAGLPVMGKSAWKLNSSGIKVREYNIGGAIANGIAVDSADNVYIAGTRINGKSVWKFDSSGILVGSYDTGDDALGIAVDSDDNIYVVGISVNGKSVWKLNSSCVWQWDFNAGSIAKSISIDYLDNIYIGSDRLDDPGGPCVWQLDSSGNLIWNYDAGNSVEDIAVRR